MDEEVFWVVDVSVGSGLDAVDYLFLHVNTAQHKVTLENRPTLGSRSSRMARGIYRVSSLCLQPYIISNQTLLHFNKKTYLVEKHILAVSALGRKVFEIAILVDPMLLAKLLPELAANYTRQVNSCLSFGGLLTARGCRRTVIAALAGLDCDDFSVHANPLILVKQEGKKTNIPRHFMS